MIAENNNRFCCAYHMKETLRLLLKIKDTEEAEVALKRWLKCYNLDELCDTAVAMAESQAETVCGHQTCRNGKTGS